MTDSQQRRRAVSTEVLLVQRARRRRAETYRRRRLTAGAIVVAAIAVLTATAVASIGDEDGAKPLEVAAGSTTTTPPSEATSTTGEVGVVASTPTMVTTPGTPAPGTPEAECSSAAWPVNQRAALTVFATVGGPSDLQASITRGFGGVFIPSDAISLVTGGTLKQRLDDADRAPLSSIDEEGGRVQRLQTAIGAIPSAREMHELGPDQIRQLATVHGKSMMALGLSMDFAPVVDLVEDSDVDGDGGIGDRSFSADPLEATADARAFAAGLAASGVLPTYKHFPGHGHASLDSHKGLPTTPDLAALKTNDLVPYAELLADEPTAAVMIGHLSVPGLTGGEPASVSKAAITGLLRTDMAFDGLVVTDDLGNMAGILDRYTTVEASVLSVAAGADMVLVPFTDGDQVVSSIVAAVRNGQIPDGQLTASADRVLRAQQPLACPVS